MGSYGFLLDLLGADLALKEMGQFLAHPSS